jgi:serine/threonine protein kinase
VWSVGQKIGDYELVAHLRDGGMASLFLARRLGAAGFQRDVAIKIVHPELASDPQFRAMFLDEALLSARIQHPNVGHVEELGEIDGTHFLVMEFVHGCSLAQLQRALVMKGRRLAPAFATRIAMHVADGLHAAHETCDEHGRRLDVVHRDVSPENILLAYAGHVKLIDFGIAKAYGRRHRTEDGLLKGKFRYMSPEQASGQPIDRRTDVYQLGIVLWEMLTLRRLFDAETDVDLLQQVRAPKIVPPSALVDRISPALDAVVMSALDPNPGRRPPDAQTFARRLGKAVPSAHEVDGGSLSGLLLAVMQEQRREQKKTYPSGLYDRLEQQVPTQQAEGGQAGDPRPPIVRRYTMDHTSPYGSDSPQAPDPSKRPRGRAGQPRRGVSTEPAYHGAGAGPRAAADVERGAPRPRRLVRLASGLFDTLSELGTSITRLASLESPGRKAAGLLALGAVALALMLAFATLLWKSAKPTLRSALPSVPTAPPLLPPVNAAKSQALDGDVPLVLTPIRTLQEGTPVSPAGEVQGPHLQAVEVPAHARSSVPASSGDTSTTSDRARGDSERKPSTKLASPIAVDGTPLIPDPGF